MTNLEDIYELSPLQHGIIFQSLFDPKSGLYVIQSSMYLDGELNVACFEQSWQQVTDRHPVLRTSFSWREIDKPLQIVHSMATIPLTLHDWRSLGAGEQTILMDSLLETDRLRNFDLSAQPLMRLTLVRTKDNVHRFIWTFHHLLLDGRSSSLVLREVAAFYEAASNADCLVLRSPRPYRDYIVWLQRRDLSGAERFWREALKGFTSATPLGVDQSPLESHQEHNYGELRTALSTSTTLRLQSFARSNQLTPNTVVQGAWARLLSHYSGHREVAFGAIVSGRPVDLDGAEFMVGLFINTLLVRVDMEPSKAVLPWLKEIQARRSEISQYDFTPLVRVQGWSEVDRGQPMFESIFVFENYLMEAPLTKMIGGLGVRGNRSFERTGYPLTIVAEPGPELLLRILYDCRRFDDLTIQRMLGHLSQTVQIIIDGSVHQLEGLTAFADAECHQVLREWNDTRASSLRERALHELFEDQVDRNPDTVALVFRDQEVTYHELDRRANQVAHYLRGRCIGPGELVGIYMNRSVEMLVALLGILKAGGAYVPLDPMYPKERLHFMVTDSGLGTVLTEDALSLDLPGAIAACLCLDKDWGSIALKGEKRARVTVSPSNLAYVIYTSGSTGMPKGVAIAHKGLCNVADAQVTTFGIRRGDYVLQFSSLSFDASAFEMMMAFRVGATLCLVPRQDAVPGPQLLQYLLEQGVTLVTLPPSALSALPTAELPALQTITVAGEACSAQLVDIWSEGRAFFNLYGPTEATIWATTACCNERGRPPSIGLPIVNTRVFLLDQHHNPLPFGIAGELCIAGSGLARGYMNRPDLSAEKFIPDPFSDEQGARQYRTGDLARRNQDGSIQFLGRRDHQVKIRGFRVEIGEVEAALREHQDLKDVMVCSDPPGGRLVAYVVASNGAVPQTGHLLTFLRQTLPDYMVPSVFVVVDEFPLTPNGKIDRKALPHPDGRRPDLEFDYTVPQTDMERIVASIWKDVLKLDRAGARDNFFDLGGHSLLIIQVQNKIQEELGQEIPISDLFRYPTIDALAQHLSQTGDAALSREQYHESQVQKLGKGKERLKRIKHNQLAARGAKGFSDE
jgi:amino acid adenylation domain-containing protein